MRLVDVVRGKQEALRVRDLAQLLGVSQQQIYKMTASGEIPSFKVANAVRFDPYETAEWLKEKYWLDGLPTGGNGQRLPVRSTHRAKLPLSA